MQEAPCERELRRWRRSSSRHLEARISGRATYTLAEAEWRNALAVDPKIGEVHNNLAVVCLMTDSVDEAAEHVKHAEKAGVRVNPQLKTDIEARRH